MTEAQAEKTSDQLSRAVRQHKQGRIGEAATLYQRVLEREPRNADALHGMGIIAHQLGRANDTVEFVRRAIQVNRHVPAYYNSLAIAFNTLGRQDLADEAQRQASQAEQYSNYNLTTLPKLRHDIEQLRYLEVRGLAVGALAGAAQRFEGVLAELQELDDGGEAIELDGSQIDRIGDVYNQPLHLAPGAALADGALNPALDPAAILRDYAANAPGMTVVDDFLTDAALHALGRFCLESTIWFDYRHRGGYLGAYQTDGFDSPLLHQIAEELRSRLPELLQAHPLRYMWAFKYDSRRFGIGPHADSAAVNVNFWITPDSANLDSKSGGLVVNKVEAPTGWDFDDYNTDQGRVKSFLAENDRGHWVIPHRQNRAVIFNSNLFHATDAIRFREGYENRRINITMLFGDR